MNIYIKSLAIACVFALLPEAAWAYTLQCANGLPAGGDIFLGAVDCHQYGAHQPFSGLNCYFQQVLNEVTKRMYCGIQFRLMPFLQVMILLFVLVYAIMFTMGLAALTGKELVTRCIKMALVWAFAMNASWGVGMAFYFLVGGIETVATWVIQVFFPDMQGMDFIAYIDFLIFQQLTGGFTAKGAALLGFFGTLAVLMFPVFLLFLVYMMTVMAALMRAVITYLLGLSAIAFLIALGPIFVSFALFKTTFTFFDSWFRYLVSFSLQIILVFAAVALWLYVMSLVGNFFLVLMNMIIPYEDKAHSMGSAAIFKDTWAICLNGAARDGISCVGNRPALSPAAYSVHERFIAWLTLNLIVLGTLVYAFDALLRMMPNFARQLSGPAFAPQLGGGSSFGAIQMPGLSQIGQLKTRLLYTAKNQLLSKFSSHQLQGQEEMRVRRAAENAGGEAPARGDRDPAGAGPMVGRRR